MFLKFRKNSQENTCVRISFLFKVTGVTPFLQNIPERLLLWIQNRCFSRRNYKYAWVWIMDKNSFFLISLSAEFQVLFFYFHPRIFQLFRLAVIIKFRQKNSRLYFSRWAVKLFESKDRKKLLWAFCYVNFCFSCK